MFAEIPVQPSSGNSAQQRDANYEKEVPHLFFPFVSKNLTFAGKHAAQAWHRLAERPKCLLPKISRAGTIRLMMIPAAHHGQGLKVVPFLDDELC